MLAAEHLDGSVRRASGFVQTGFSEMSPISHALLVAPAHTPEVQSARSSLAP